MSDRAYRLHNKHTPDELVQMQREIRRSLSYNPATGVLRWEARHGTKSTGTLKAALKAEWERQRNG